MKLNLQCFFKERCRHGGWTSVEKLQLSSNVRRISYWLDAFWLRPIVNVKRKAPPTFPERMGGFSVGAVRKTVVCATVRHRWLKTKDRKRAHRKWTFKVHFIGLRLTNYIALINTGYIIRRMPRRRKEICSIATSSMTPRHSTKEKPQQRNAANARERARMRVLSRAFCRLKTTLPWVPADTKLSKLDTLRLATTYIAHLRAVLIDGTSTTSPLPSHPLSMVSFYSIFLWDVHGNCSKLTNVFVDSVVLKK